MNKKADPLFKKVCKFKHSFIRYKR